MRALRVVLLVLSFQFPPPAAPVDPVIRWNDEQTLMVAWTQTSQATDRCVEVVRPGAVGLGYVQLWCETRSRVRGVSVALEEAPQPGDRLFVHEWRRPDVGEVEELGRFEIGTAPRVMPYHVFLAGVLSGARW